MATVKGTLKPTPVVASPRHCSELHIICIQKIILIIYRYDYPARTTLSYLFISISDICIHLNIVILVLLHRAIASELFPAYSRLGRGNLVKTLRSPLFEAFRVE